MTVGRSEQFQAPFATSPASLSIEGCSLVATGVTGLSLIIITARGVAGRRRLAINWRTALAELSLALTGVLAFAGHALAQTATSPAGGIGAQMNLMSSEAINSGGTAFGMGCYLAAAACFGFGSWALWQSRQPQNREAGHVSRGVVGLVLCGLLATAGTWINKAAVSTSGGAASINNNPAMVHFGTGG